MEKAFTKTAEKTAQELQTDLKNGLSAAEADARLKKYGPNILKEKRGKNPLVLFFI